MNTFEYKVLGHGTVEVAGRPVSLADAVTRSHVADIRDVLNVLGEEGWELLALEPPFVFKRAFKRAGHD